MTKNNDNKTITINPVEDTINLFNEKLKTLRTAVDIVKNKILLLDTIVSTALKVYLDFNNKTCLIALIKDNKTFNPYFKRYFDFIGLSLKYDEEEESLKIFKSEDFVDDYQKLPSYFDFANKIKEDLKKRKEKTLKVILSDTLSEDYKSFINNRIKNLFKDIPNESLKDFKEAIKKELK